MSSSDNYLTKQEKASLLTAIEKGNLVRKDLSLKVLDDLDFGAVGYKGEPRKRRQFSNFLGGLKRKRAVSYLALDLIPSRVRPSSQTLKDILREEGVDWKPDKDTLVKTACRDIGVDIRTATAQRDRDITEDHLSVLFP